MPLQSNCSAEARQEFDRRVIEHFNAVGFEAFQAKPVIDAFLAEGHPIHRATLYRQVEKLFASGALHMDADDQPLDVLPTDTGELHPAPSSKWSIRCSDASRPPTHHTTRPTEPHSPCVTIGAGA